MLEMSDLYIVCSTFIFIHSLLSTELKHLNLFSNIDKLHFTESLCHTLTPSSEILFKDEIKTLRVHIFNSNSPAVVKGESSAGASATECCAEGNERTYIHPGCTRE